MISQPLLPYVPQTKNRSTSLMEGAPTYSYGNDRQNIITKDLLKSVLWKQMLWYSSKKNIIQWEDIENPLMLRTHVFLDEEWKVCSSELFLDLCFVWDDFRQEVIAEIRTCIQNKHTEYAHILPKHNHRLSAVRCSHTHQGPWWHTWTLLYDASCGWANTILHKRLIEICVSWFFASLEQAKKSATEVEIIWLRVNADSNLFHNRSFSSHQQDVERGKESLDRSTLTENKKEMLDLWIDTSLQVKLIRDKTSQEIAWIIVSWWAHPTILNNKNKMLSADRPWLVEQLLHEKLKKLDVQVSENCVVTMWPWYCGDMTFVNPNRSVKGMKERRERNSDPKRVIKNIGKSLATSLAKGIKEQDNKGKWKYSNIEHITKDREYGEHVDLWKYITVWPNIMKGTLEGRGPMLWQVAAFLLSNWYAWQMKCRKLLHSYGYWNAEYLQLLDAREMNQGGRPSLFDPFNKLWWLLSLSTIPNRADLSIAVIKKHIDAESWAFPDLFQKQAYVHMSMQSWILTVWFPAEVTVYAKHLLETWIREICHEYGISPKDVYIHWYSNGYIWYVTPERPGDDASYEFHHNLRNDLVNIFQNHCKWMLQRYSQNNIS